MSLTPEQIELRRTGLTATDLVVLASGSDWHGRTRHDVWRSKVLGQEDFIETEAMQIGSELEPIVIRRTAERRNLATLEGRTVVHPEHPRYIATPDAFAVGRLDGSPDALIQAKVVGYHMARSWGEDGTGVDSIPEVVFVQCAWELFVTRRPVVYVGALIGTEVRTYMVDFDNAGAGELVEGLREIGDRFWRDHVVTKRPPDVDGSEGAKRMIRAIWPRPTRPKMMAPASVEPWVARYFKARKILAAAEAAKDLAQQKIEEACGPHEGMFGDGWRLNLKFRDATAVPASVRRAYRHFDLRAVKGERRGP